MDEILNLFDYVLKTFNAGESPQTFLVLVGLAFARIIAFVAFVPFFGGTIVSSRVKVATALSLVVIAYPALLSEIPTDGTPLPFGTLGFLMLMLKEFFVGFTFAYVSSSVFEGIQMAGRFIDVQRGSSMSEVMAPQIQEKVSEIGQFQFQLALIIFFMLGLHRAFIRALIESFTIIPATKFPEMTGGWTPAAELITQTTFHALYIGVQLSMPIVLALLMTDMFFGIVNKVAPQINVFFLSMPVKMGLGIFLLLLMLPALQEQIAFYLVESLETLQFMIRFFGTKPAF